MKAHVMISSNHIELCGLRYSKQWMKSFDVDFKFCWSTPESFVKNISWNPSNKMHIAIKISSWFRYDSVQYISERLVLVTFYYAIQNNELKFVGEVFAIF